MTEDIAILAGKRPGPGTLYDALRRLERNPYRLTTRGSRVLKARIAARETLARAGLKQLADA